MNLDSLSFSLSQINYLVANLTKKNLKQSTQELTNLVAVHSFEADRHLLRCLFSHIDLSSEGGKSTNGNSKDSLQIQLLSQECANLLSKPTLISHVCYAIDHPLNQQKTLKPSQQFFVQLRKLLKLTPVQEVVFGIALGHSSNPEFQKLSGQFTKQKLPDLIRAYIDAENNTSHQQEGGLHDTTPEVLHLILTHLNQDNTVVSFDTKSVFWKRLQRDFPREHVPVILAPLLYPSRPDLPMDKVNLDTGTMANNMLENSLPEMIMEVGYSFCSSVEECKNILINLGPGNLTPAGVARILTMMMHPHANISEQAPNFWGAEKSEKSSNETNTNHATSWNVEVFVQAVKEISPNMPWKEVVVELDNPDFLVKDRIGFNLLFSGFRLVFDRHFQPFPIDVLYRKWKNTDGQYSLILQILKNPDTISFTDYPYHPVNVDSLKALPDNDNKELLTWRSLDLIEILLYLSDRGLYQQVQELFKFPMQHCPDVLVLGLIQVKTHLNLLREEMLTNLMPIFLSNHPNSAIVLHQVWNSNDIAIKSIVMHAMAEWYLRSENDQTRLSRILDVAQDLKALSMLLNAQSFPFVIDLACLASRRGYLKLEKWLTDKIHDHGEPFVSACTKFLQRRCPQIMGNVKEENIPKAGQLLHETVATMLACLQVCASNVSQELSDVILTMVANCNLLLNKARQPPPGVLRHRTALDAAFNPLLGSPHVDQMANLGTSLASMNLGALGGIGPQSSSAFSLPGGLGSLVSTPGSPSRIMGQSVPGPSQSPFPIMPLGSALQHPVGAPQVPNVSGVGVGSIGGTLSRIPTTLFNDLSQNPSKEVEDEANSYFQRIYNHPPHPTLSIEEVLEMLKKFMESSDKRERDVFQCMVKNLFEEYRFFPQYPDKELHITAQLFGGIIERGLTSSFMVLGLALRFVLDALRKPYNSKMYFFGIAALDRFKSKLKEYQKYCEHVASIPHFHEFPPHLIEYVQCGLQQQEPVNRPQGPVLPPNIAILLQLPSTTVYKTITTTTVTTTTTVAKVATTSSLPTRPSIANATNIDTLLVATEKEEKMIQPPEGMQDKVAFIFNNLSQLNLQPKCDELRDLVTEEYWPWMAQYLVMKRASIELNFHVLYSNFLDVLKIPEINKMVLRETFRNIKVLLRSDKGIANFSDRSLLRNLGHWLGMLTLGRNQPILHNDIDLKSLLVEAYHKGQQELFYVVPFVAKVLDSCAKSKIFKPRNPWTMAIMNVLAELHSENTLKLNLKFEIEVLCKTLNIDVSELKPVIYIKDPLRLENLEHQLSQPDKKTEQVNLNQIQTQQQAQANLMATAEELIPNTSILSSAVVSSAAAVLPPTNTTPTPSLALVPSESKLNYVDLNVSNVAGLANFITINKELPLVQSFPQLKSYVLSAIDRSVQEWLHPVMDRSIKIAVVTTEHIVKQDFAVDPDESRLRQAAHNMVSSLTAGMAMITSRDHMLSSIVSHLKTSLTTVLPAGTATDQHKVLIEKLANTIAEDNVDMACNFIQKAAMEKSVTEIDKRLANEFELRKQARNEGRRYCDSQVLTYQAERMPEQIRLKVGGVPHSRMRVYEEYSKMQPGFQSMPDRDNQQLYMNKPLVEPLPVTPFSAVGPGQVAYPSDEVGQLYEKLMNELDAYLQVVLNNNMVNPLIVHLHNLRDNLSLSRRARDPPTAAILVQKAVEGLFEGILQMSSDTEILPRYKDFHLRVLKLLQDQRVYGSHWTNKQVTRCLMDLREELRYMLEPVDCLIRSGLVNMQQYDQFIAQCMEKENNYLAIIFGMHLVQMYLIEDRLNSIATEDDFLNIIEMLMRIQAMSRDPNQALNNLLEVLKASHDPTALTDIPPVGPLSHIHSGMLLVRARDIDDSGSLIEKTEFLMLEWIQMSSSRETNKSFSYIIHQMSVSGILKSDDMITRFFKIATQFTIDLCYRSLSDVTNTKTKCYQTTDGYARLVALLVKHSADSGTNTTKINLLNKILGIVVGCLLVDHEMRQLDFRPLPYQRILIMLFLELNQPDPVLETINFQVVTSYCHVLHLIRPTKAPGFAYSWLELVSHRVFIGKILQSGQQQKGWSMYSQLLISLFKFLSPFLRNAEISKPISSLYKGTLRVLLVLLHDFPEFLCEYHYGFCDVIPSNSIQMRNLILSAFPRNMRLPDPFTPNLKVDVLSEIQVPPRIVSNFVSMITPISFKKDLDSYLKQRSPVTFLSSLRSSLQSNSEPGVSYNVQLMNALVVYVGTQAIHYIRSKGLTPNMSTIASSAHMDIFQNLGVDLDTQGRYLFLNAIANQLRYPNSHTHYFSCTLLYLFAESNTESIQEQITRVLLERLIVNRPHPWGLLITFIELIKNPAYKFWSHEFVHCAPEIEKLFESVARSCMVPKQINQQQPENDIGEPLAV